MHEKRKVNLVVNSNRRAGAPADHAHEEVTTPRSTCLYPQS